MGDEASYSATQVEELLKCPICLDRFKTPKHLPCQHTVCKQPCLARLLATNPRFLHCPQCRKLHSVPAGGVNAFPDNIIINNLLDLPRTRTASSFKCSDCERTENLSLCKHCDRQVCAECRPSHLTSMRDEIQEIVQRVRRKLPQLTQKVGECRQRQNGQKVCFQKLRHEIDNVIDGKIRALKERKQLLLTEVEVLEQGRQHELQERQEKYEMDTAFAASFCDSADHDLQNIASVTDLTKLKKQSEEILKNLDKQERERTVTDVRFEHEDGQLNHAVSTFGRLSTGSDPSTSNYGNGPETSHQRPEPRRSWSQQSTAPNPATRTRAFESNISMLGLGFNDTYPSRQTPSSFFGPYPTNTRRTDSPPIPTMAVSPRQPEPSPRREVQEAFSGFISLENPNFRRQRRRPPNNARQSTNQARRRSHPAGQSRGQPQSRRTWQPEARPAPLQRQGTFTRDDDDDDDDIVTANDQRRAISFQISMNDPRPLPPRTPNSIEAQRPVNNYEQKRPYRTVDTRRGQAWFQNCTGIALQPETDNFYIVDDEASKILIFDSNGRHIKSFGTLGNAQGEFDKPFDAIFRGDNLYVTDAGNNRLQAFTPDGQIVALHVNYNFQWPQGIGTDGTSLYICDSGHGKIAVRGSERVTTFQHDQVPKPTYIAVNRSRLVVSDPDIHAVFLFSLDGSLLRKFGQEGSAVGHLLRPTGLDIDFQGFILVSNSSNHRVDIFRENGRFLCTFGERGQGQGHFNKLQGLVVTSNGRVAICDGNKVEIF